MLMQALIGGSALRDQGSMANSGKEGWNRHDDFLSSAIAGRKGPFDRNDSSEHSNNFGSWSHLHPSGISPSKVNLPFRLFSPLKKISFKVWSAFGVDLKSNETAPTTPPM